MLRFLHLVIETAGVNMENSFHLLLFPPTFSAYCDIKGQIRKSLAL
jgi:hypothetical protein